MNSVFFADLLLRTWEKLPKILETAGVKTRKYQEYKIII